MNLYHFFFLALFSLLLCNCLFPISFLKDSILLLANCLTIDDQENEVIIISISNNILETQGNRLSSVAGGTVMYLKGSGFASVLTKNVITVGNVPATILSNFFFFISYFFFISCFFFLFHVFLK